MQHLSTKIVVRKNKGVTVMVTPLNYGSDMIK